MINPAADRAVYRQLADILRDQIISGIYDSSGMLPSADGIARQHHVGTAVAEQALGVLRLEGWIETSRGQRARILPEPERTVLVASPGAVVETRRPTTDEVRRWNLRDGERVTVVSYEDESESECWPSDRCVVYFRRDV